MPWRPASRWSGRSSANFGRSSRSARRPTCFACSDEESLEIDARARGRRRHAGPARRAGEGRPVRRRPSSRRSSSCRVTGLPMYGRSAPTTSGSICSRKAAAASRRWPFAPSRPRSANSCSRTGAATVHVAGSAVRQLLERKPQRAVPHRRRGAGLRHYARTVCSRVSSPICAFVVS